MRHILIFFLCLITLTTSAFAVQYENLVIEKIEVVGNTPEGSFFDTKQVLSRIKTREGDLFSQVTFDNDLKSLAAEYDRVEPQFEIVNKKLVLKLKVSPRPMIRSITWEGNASIDTKDLQKEMGISICTVFDRLAFNKAFHKLKAYYIKKGFFEAELSYDVKLDPLTNEVDIAVCICEGRSGWISRIYFHNFTCEEEEIIAEMMVTKKYNVFLSWLNNEGIYNEDAIQYDQAQMINYMQNQGFSDAIVKIEPQDSPQFFERVHLHITLERGALYTVGKISFDGNKLFCDEEIERCLLIEEGEPFSPDAIRESASRIESLYGRKGHIDASVSFEPKLEFECGNVYSVHLEIDEGDAYRVGLIKVFGNCTTQTNVILHETLLVPGELFNTDKLKLTEERLQNIGYFSNVNVYAVRTEKDGCLPGNYRDVHVEVEEKQTGRFGTFFGYSTVESLFGGFNITEKNFNSAGLACLFSDRGPGLRGGGEFLNGTIQVGQKSRSYGLSWTKPYFMDTKWSVGFDLENSSNRYISDDYNIKAVGYTLRANYALNAFMRFGWHYRIRHTNVDLDGHAAKGMGNCELYKASCIQGLISASGFSFGYDSTDRVEMPTKGFRSMLELEYAGLGGDHTFLALAYLNSYYIPLPPKGVFKIRGDVRFLQPLWRTGFSHIPLDERLYLGGDNTVRGYKAYKLGPRFGEKGDPKGGLSMQIISFEYNHFLFKRANAFVFLDAGSLTDHNWHIGHLYTSAGIGARVRVMDSFPPVTFGMGWPLNPKSDGQVKRFFISFGGSF